MDGPPADPSVLPEEGVCAVSELHGSGGEEERALLGIELEVEACPCSGVVRAAEPQPAGAERKAGPSEVAHAEATERERPSDALPVDMAVASICLRASSPQEASLDFLECPDGLLGGARARSWWIGIALRMALTNARRPALFMSHAFHPGSIMAVL